MQLPTTIKQLSWELYDLDPPTAVPYMGCRKHGPSLPRELNTLYTQCNYKESTLNGARVRNMNLAIFLNYGVLGSLGGLSVEYGPHV